MRIGGFYIGVAKILRNRQVQGMELLAECFLSLGVIFTSLSVPYILDGGWIAATWALEGAAMIWIGIRQNRGRTRLFGALLQLAAGFSFLITLENQNVELIELMVLNSSYIGTLVVDGQCHGDFTSYRKCKSCEQSVGFLYCRICRY